MVKRFDDEISNIIDVFVQINLKDPADCSLSAILLGTITRGLESSDRFVVLRCMETLGRLAQRAENELLLMSSLDSHVSEIRREISKFYTKKKPAEVNGVFSN